MTEAAATERRPLVGIVILNYARWRDTIACLESVLRSTYSNYRVFLCDNGSPDDSRDQMVAWARGDRAIDLADGLPDELRPLVSPPIDKPIMHSVLERDQPAEPAAADAVTFINTGANLGFVGGNNIGIRHALAAGAEYVLLLNNDTLVAPGAIAAVVAAAERDRSLGLVGGTILEFHEPDRVQAAGGGIEHAWSTSVWMTRAGSDRTAARTGGPMDFVSGCFMLIRAEAARAVGLLDPRFFIYFEDVDYGIRMRRAGWRLGYAPDAELWHRGSATTDRRGPMSDYYLSTSALRLTWKHRPALLPTVLAYSVYRWVAPKVVRRQWDRLHAVGDAYRDFFARGLGASDRPLIRR